MDNADSQLEWSDESIRDTFREPTAEQQFRQQLVYTNYLTRSISTLRAFVKALGGKLEIIASFADASYHIKQFKQESADDPVLV